MAHYSTLHYLIIFFFFFFFCFSSFFFPRFLYSSLILSSFCFFSPFFLHFRPLLLLYLTFNSSTIYHIFYNLFSHHSSVSFFSSFLLLIIDFFLHLFSFLFLFLLLLFLFLFFLLLTHFSLSYITATTKDNHFYNIHTH